MKWWIYGWLGWAHTHSLHSLATYRFRAKTINLFLFGLALETFYAMHEILDDFRVFGSLCLEQKRGQEEVQMGELNEPIQTRVNVKARWYEHSRLWLVLKLKNKLCSNRFDLHKLGWRWEYYSHIWFHLVSALVKSFSIYDLNILEFYYLKIGNNSVD